jgi:hypothetical protein
LVEISIGESGWAWSPDHGQLCQVIEAQMLWGETTCRVWLPDRDSVVRKIPENVFQEDPKLLMWYDQALTRSGEG